MFLELTESEIKTLLFYIDKSLIDAKGLAAVGMVSKKEIDDLESVKEKISK